MSLVKPSGIQGLDSSHPLSANISQFFEFGQTDKELVADAAFTYNGVAGSDADIGDSVLVTSSTTGTNATLNVSNNNTILVVYKHVGSDAGHAGLAGEFQFAYGEANGDAIKLHYSPFSGYRYETTLRANFSAYTDSRYDSFDNAGYSLPHALAWSFDVTSAAPFRTVYLDGAEETATATEAAISSAFASEPVALNMVDSCGSTGDTRVAAIVVFNKRLSASEMASVTTDPWAMLSTGAASVSLSAADNITSEGQTVTFTLANNAGAPTGATLNGTDVGTLTDQGSGVYAYTSPLIADDATADLVVSVDSTTVSTQISYANSYPYELVTHGTPDANSIFFDTQFATTGPVEWGVVTDYDSAIVTVDHAAMDTAEDELNDVDLHSTEVAAGTTTATYKYFVPESGATGTWDATITVEEEVTQAPQGTITVGTITKDENSASIPFTYSDTDQDSFEYSLDSGTSWTTTTSPISLTGLDSGQLYSGLIRPRNSVGTGTNAGFSFSTDAASGSDNWPFSKGIRHAATKNWEWGKRHPLTGMRVRVYK